MAAAPDHQREPCPSRIIDDVGGAFAMGAGGGGAWNAFKLMKNSPNGYRLKGFIEGIRVHAPRVGGSFAGWGACYAAADCTLLGLRGKDDPLNSIAAGAFAGGLLQARQGMRSALRSAAVGGFLLAMIEGMGIALQRMAAEAQRTQAAMAAQAAAGAGPVPQAGPMTPDMALAGAPPTGQPEASGGGGFFGGWFGGGAAPAPATSSAVPVDLTDDKFAAPVNPFK